MISTLISVQLRAVLSMLFSRSNAGKKRSLGGKILIGLGVLYIAGSLGIATGFYFRELLNAFLPAGLTWLYFSMAGIAAFVLSFVGSVFLAQSSLFLAKDNDLLLSLPIPPRNILVARTAVLYLTALFFQTVILAPALVVWLLKAPVSVAGLVMFALCGLLLPMMTLTLSILLGWLLSFITARIKRKNLVTILLSLLFLGAYFLGYTWLMGQMSSLLSRGEQLADAVRGTLFSFYHFGLAIAPGNPVSLLAFAACCLIPFVLLMALVSSNYLSILTTRRGAQKIAYHGGGIKASSLPKALVRKELTRFFTSPVYLMNTGIGLFFMLALPLFLLFDKGGSLQTMIAQFNLSGDLLGAAAALALALMAGTVDISAPSISLEGKSLWILQSLPVKPIQALLAKAAAHVLLCVPPILVSGILMAVVLRLGIYSTVMAILLPLLASVFSALLGVAVNLRFPKLLWRTETEPVKQGVSVILTMGLGFLSIAGLAALYILVLRKVMGAGLYLLVSAAAFALMSLLIYLHLRRRAPDTWLDLSEA